MDRVGLVFAILLMLASAATAAAETRKTSKRAPTHMVCIAMAKPVHNKTYSSPVFAFSGPTDPTHVNGLAFTAYLGKKYGYPAAGGDATCIAGQAAGLEDYKKQRLGRLPNVIHTGWTPAVVR
jgi:hypothetical protein